MTTERIDVLATLRVLAVKAPIANDVHAAVAELIDADLEYEGARRDWDDVTAHDPEETSDETWRRVADRYEAAVMRRATALARVRGSA